ncbi:MAG: hypothetical protein JXA07_09535 [Spirochaetes bacterium]|nr:hypothetical protein [Spirochaetota bacterium]
MKTDIPSNKRAHILTIMVAVIIASAVSIFLSYRYILSRTVRDVYSYLETIQKMEHRYIELIPLYEDYATTIIEKQLRTRLFQDHMRIALGSGNKPLERDEDIEPALESGRLVSLESGADAPYYFYNVRKLYRALDLDTARGLDRLAHRFQDSIMSRGDLPPVKIAISSALRPASYQSVLRDLNENAVPITTHSYSVSFDVFYDDYYVVLPYPENVNTLSAAIIEMMRTRIGFMLGDSLRSQFRSVLAETLVRLQEEGLLYAILEKRQKCYHVTIIPAGDVKAPHKEPVTIGR